MTDYALSLSDVELERYRRMAQQARETEAELWSTAGITAGARVLDVGCGPAATLAVISDIVGASGVVSGVEANPATAAEARQLLAGTSHPAAPVLVADAAATGVEPGSFDVVMMRHVLAHNGGREQSIVNHLAELVRPGGSVLLVENESTMTRIHPPLAALVEIHERYVEFHRGRGNDVQIALRLPELLAGAGTKVIEQRGRLSLLPRRTGQRGPAWAARQAMVDDGVITPADIRRWDEAFDALDAQQTTTTGMAPTYFLAGVSVIGRRRVNG